MVQVEKIRVALSQAGNVGPLSLSRADLRGSLEEGRSPGRPEPRKVPRRPCAPLDPSSLRGPVRRKALSAAARTPRSRGPESAVRRTLRRGEKAASPRPALLARLLLGPPPDFGWRRWSVFEGRIRGYREIGREGNTPELLERPWERRKIKKLLILKIKIWSEIMIPLAFPLRLAPTPYRARRSWLRPREHEHGKNAFWALRSGTTPQLWILKAEAAKQ